MRQGAARAGCRRAFGVVVPADDDGHQQERDQEQWTRTPEPPLPHGSHRVPSLVDPASQSVKRRARASGSNAGEVALAFLVLAYTLRVGLSGRFLRSANLLDSLGLVAISGLLVWQVIERLHRPSPVPGMVPIIAGLTATAANWGVARTVRAPATEDAAVRLAYVHNLGDTLVSLAPVVAGALTLASGSPFADPLVALVIAGAIVVPTVGTIAGAHEELVWPENVACAHAAAGDDGAVAPPRSR
jgi:cobalt-zinc-cadmium efflux system protein